MPLDAVFLSGLAKELSAKITGARVDKIQQPERDLLLFGLHMRDRNGKLLIHGGVGSARVHLTKGVFENPSSPPMLCMLLRKHLTGARILEVFQPEMERVLIIRFAAHNDLGIGSQKSLIIEMMGRQSNVVLTDSDDIILDCMRRVDPSMSEIRPLLPGMRYRLPPKQSQPNIFSLDRESRRQILQDVLSGADVVKTLSGKFSGLSPLICREICFRAFGSVDVKLHEPTDNQITQLLDEIDHLSNIIAEHDLIPVMLLEEKQPKDFSFIPIMQYQNAYIRVERDSFSDLLDEFYLRRDQIHAARRRSQSLTKAVTTHRDRLARKLALQKEELLRCENRDQIRQHAELITANMFRIKKGDRCLVAEDYHDPSLPSVEIPLDPMKTPQQNAETLFKKYRKAKTAEIHLRELIQTGETELQYLNSVLDILSRTESEQDLSVIRAELQQTGYIKSDHRSKNTKQKPRAPLRFQTDTGYEVLVGKSNAQNDELTFRVARRTDIWLHVQKSHGSHVIIRMNDAQPDELTIRQAACLAVYYSQARDGGKTPVDYTMVRNVRKPSGALPGMVIYSPYQSILAEPDEELVAKLRIH